MARELRSEKLQVKVTEADRAAIEKAADKEGVTVSEYIRESILLRMVLDRNPHGFKAVGRGLLTYLHDLGVRLPAVKSRAA